MSSTSVQVAVRARPLSQRYAKFSQAVFFFFDTRLLRSLCSISVGCLLLRPLSQDRMSPP